MTPDEAILVLDTLAAPFPWWQLDDKAIDAWVDALVAVGGPYEHARQVALRWGRANERPPSLAHLLALVRPAPDPRPVDPDDHVAAHPSVAKRVKALYLEACRRIDQRTAAAELIRGVDGHWHGDGAAGCPICSGRAAEVSR